MEIEKIIETISNQTGTLVFSWIVILLSIIIKDILISLASGLLFYFDPHFQEGDVIYFENKKCIVQKIGISKTVFRTIEGNRWIYIKNERMKFYLLEKPEKNNQGD